MSNAFVGTSPTAVPLKDLKAAIERCIGADGWLFLRWPHKVSGMQPLGDSLDELPQPADGSVDCITHCEAGQAFDNVRELRWRRRGSAFELLLLSDSGADAAFRPLARSPNQPISWDTQVFNATPLANTETRLPTTIHVPDELNLEQRYFIDADTAAVQFIALRAAEKENKTNGSE